MAATPDDEMLVEQVRTWFMKTEMDALFETAVAFADQHCDIFEPELGEHKHEYNTLHQQFTQLFEDKLNAFLASVGRRPEEFYVALKQCHAKNDERTKNMADLMFTCLDYEFFCMIMCERKQEKSKASAASAEVPRQLQVTVPEGVGPGMSVQITTPEGSLMQVIVPEGVGPGGSFIA